MKIFEQILLKKLPEYEAEGLIDPASRGRLESHLQASVQAASGVWWWVLYVLGGILVSLGVILAVRNNWYDFSPGMRLFIGAVPLLASAVIGAWVLATRPNGLWAVFIPLLNIAGVMCAIAVTAQVYQLKPDSHAFFWTVLWLVLPLPFLFRSQLTPAACLILLACWAGGVERGKELWAPIFFCAYAAPMLWLILRPYGKGGAPLQWMAVAAAGIALPIGLANVWDIFSQPDNLRFDFSVPAVALCVSAYLLWYVRIRRRGNNGWGAECALSLLGLILFTIMTLVWGGRFLGGTRRLSPFWEALTTSWTWVDLSFLAVISAGVLVWLYRAHWKRDGTLPYLCAALIGLFGPLWFVLGPFEGALRAALRYGCNLLLVIAIISFLLDGIRRRLYGPLNTGIAMLLLFAWVRFVEHNFSLLARAIAFIVLGLFLIGMNVWLNRARRKERPQ